jgi:hypothetical protein
VGKNNGSGMVCFYFLLAFKRGVSESGERYFSVLPLSGRSIYSMHH